jgi:DNA repair exonuclease SbcCD ATPase subunit
VGGGEGSSRPFLQSSALTYRDARSICLQVRNIAAPVATDESESPITYIQDVKAELQKLQQKGVDDDSTTAKSILQLQEQMKRMEDNQERARQQMEQMNAIMLQLLSMQQTAFATGAGKT